MLGTTEQQRNRQTEEPANRHSCLYEGRLMHQRFHPVEHRLEYPIFIFCIDLDELNILAHELPLLSRNRFNLFAFHDEDHLPTAGDAKAAALQFFEENGVNTDTVSRVLLVTFPRVLGYVFNPVSFYYALDAAGCPIAGIAEVGNTFGEQKPFLALPDPDRPDTLCYNGPKEFYVSPFSKLDDQFAFRLPVPDDSLSTKVDNISEGRITLHASLTGRRVELTNRTLARFAIRYPLITLATTWRIHKHALLLWRKGAPHQKKSANPHLQKNLHHRHPQTRNPEPGTRNPEPGTRNSELGSLKNP